MIQRNAHKHNAEGDAHHKRDPNAKAMHNQAMMPPENFR
jgi:hypothetical protein